MRVDTSKKRKIKFFFAKLLHWKQFIKKFKIDIKRRRRKKKIESNFKARKWNNYFGFIFRMWKIIKNARNLFVLCVKFTVTREHNTQTHANETKENFQFKGEKS